MNSFLQALFATDNFMRYTLSLEYSSNLKIRVLPQLQRVFAYLLLSQRYSFIPKQFLSVSKLK